MTPLPTLGELMLVDVLSKRFKAHDDVFIYFQPRLQSIRPDVVVLREHYGATIFEVKDWSIDAYNIERNQTRSHHLSWYSKSGARILSPHAQVETYKNRLFDVAGLSLANQFSPSNYGTVSCLLLFTNSSGKELKNVSTKYIKAYGRGLFDFSTYDLLNALRLNRRNSSFSPKLFSSFRMVLEPQFEPKEPAIFVHLTKRQQDAMRMPEQGKRKIRGFAGSGKTAVAISKAAEVANKGGNVLYIVYNLAAMHAVSDVLRRINLTFPRNNVTIETIFGFAKPFLGLEQSKYLRSGDMLRAAQDNIVLNLRTRTVLPDFEKYSLIILDEAQDMQPEWMKEVIQCFGNDNCQVLILADEAQNIYGNPLENKQVNTPIQGPWFSLVEHHRSHPDVSSLCDAFRKRFFNDTDEKHYQLSISTTDIRSMAVDFDKLASLTNTLTSLSCFPISSEHVSSTSWPLVIARTRRRLQEVTESLKNHPASKGLRIRSVAPTSLQSCHLFVESLSKVLRTHSSEILLDGVALDDKVMENVRSYVNTISRTEQDIAQLIYDAQYDIDNKISNDALATLVDMFTSVSKKEREANTPFDISTVERPRYDYTSDILHHYSFSLSLLSSNLKSKAFGDDECIVMSTVHSSKGIERSSVVVLIDADWENQPYAHELMYTAISRAKSNLYVLFDPRSSYSDFILEHMPRLEMNQQQ
ncbi:MAG TPA: AAA family ATPase [Chlorobiota bacterium]|nr:AAA family ATPase [Chlorobiota bacterium]